MKSLKALLALAIFGSLIYIAYRIVPIYINSYQFQDAIEEEARVDTYSQKTEQDIKDTIFKKAQSLELPVKAEQIHVQRQGNAVSISAAYIVHVDLPVYPVDLSFSPNSQGKRAY